MGHSLEVTEKFTFFESIEKHEWQNVINVCCQGLDARINLNAVTNWQANLSPRIASYLFYKEHYYNNI